LDYRLERGDFPTSTIVSGEIISFLSKKEIEFLNIL